MVAVEPRGNILIIGIITEDNEIYLNPTFLAISPTYSSCFGYEGECINTTETASIPSSCNFLSCYSIVSESIPFKT